MCDQAVIFSGTPVTLSEMLDARDKRQNIQRCLLGQSTNQSLLTATLVIAGPIKNSAVLQRVLLHVMQQVQQLLGDVVQQVLDDQQLPTGPTFYVLCTWPAERLKRAMIELEHQHPWGRLVDLDVSYWDGATVRVLSRQQLGYPERLCLICGTSAKICARSQCHELSELRTRITQIISSGKEYLDGKIDSHN